jgi:hypothetical protein
MDDLTRKITKAKWGGREHLPRKYEALSSNPSTTTKKNQVNESLKNKN